MELALRDNGWTKPFVQGNGVFHYVLFNVDERDADELRRLPGAKVCRYQNTEVGDLYCSVATSPVSEGRPGKATRHLCGGCTWPDSRLACTHLHHALIAFAPGSMPDIMEAHCDIGRTWSAGDAPRGLARARLAR